MKNNVGMIDRGIRIAISIAAVVLYFTGVIEGTVGIIALVVAGIFTLTSLVGFCPLYALVGLSTCPTKASN